MKIEAREAKKAVEGLRNLRTFKKDLVYVPEFEDEKALTDLIWDIHTMYKNGEEGWDGDATCYSSVPRIMDLTEYPYMIAIGESSTLFAFTSKSDRDCVVSDYLPDLDML